MRLQTLPSGQLSLEAADIFIVALGFESRAIHIASAASTPEKAIAFGFDHNKVLAYERNLSWFRERNFLVLEDIASSDFGNFFQQEFAKLVDQFEEKRLLKICVDVSCFDRLRLAEIILTLRNTKREMHVNFWYAIAEFQPPSSAVTRNEFAGPVHRSYSGRFLEPGRPLAVIAGLGYEPGRVMGAVEYLQASRIVALIPESPIEEYESEVLKANQTMLDELESRQIIRYPVDDPERTISILDSLIRGVQNSYNIVLLPSGPKIFVLCCLLVQTLHKSLAVWRVSSGGSIKPRDVKPSNTVVGLSWALTTDLN